MKMEDSYKWNSLRKLLRMDNLKKIFSYEYGNPVHTEEKYLIPDALYIQGLSLVKKKELKLMENLKSLVDNHQTLMNNLSQLIEIVNGNFNVPKKSIKHGTRQEARLANLENVMEKRFQGLEKQLDMILEMLKKN